MVAPCCLRCYEKYISEDGEVDSSFLQENFGSTEVIVEIADEPQEWREFRENKNLPPPIHVYVVSESGKQQVCICDCHIKGRSVLH